MTVVPIRPQKEFDVYTVRWLLDQRFPDSRWVVNSLLPEGLTLLVSPPKTGKSWIALTTAMSVCYGGSALGRFQCSGGPVLYVDLEQPAKRTQRRVNAMLHGMRLPIPDGLHFANHWPKVKDGGIEHLGEWIEREPTTRLVIVDTVAKIWPDNPANGRSQNAYYAEYDQLSQIKKIADEAGISILLLHHQNKSAPTDPLDRISGTSAFPGVADAVWILERERGQNAATLFVTGREIEREGRLELRFDPQTLQWIVTLDPRE